MIRRNKAIGYAILCKYHLFSVIIDQYYPEEEWKDEETDV